MIENVRLRRPALITFFLIAWAVLFCSVSLAESAKTLIRNASLILTMDSSVGAGDLGIVENADILIEKDKIAAVGKHRRSTGARVVDPTGMIVMPGFVDVHNHLWQSLIRGCGTDQDLMGWLDACVLPLFDPQITVSRSEAYAGVRLSTLDLIDTGVTTTVEWSHAFTPEFVRGRTPGADRIRAAFRVCVFRTRRPWRYRPYEAGQADPDRSQSQGEFSGCIPPG